MHVPHEIVRACETGQPVRVHTSEGEVLVARILSFDETEFVYAVLTSSRPERYAVCDSTGFVLALSEIEKVRLLEEPGRSRSKREATKRA